jgi:hypothetical protein
VGQGWVTSWEVPDETGSSGGRRVDRAFITTGGSASAGSAFKLCVPKAPEREVLTPKHGKCGRGYKLTSLGAEGKEGKAGKTGAEGRPGPEGKTGPGGKPGPEGKIGLEGKAGTTGFTSGELETLKGILPCIKSVKEGIGSKPTVQFSGCNVQIVNGDGKTESTNGEGNLVIGYDEAPIEQTGSHNLVLGTDQKYTSYGGIVAGAGNGISGPFASVSGGLANTASGSFSSVSGGAVNIASGESSWVSGGTFNTATGGLSSVSGGGLNTASGGTSSVSGGHQNTASGFDSSVSGGEDNTASGFRGGWIGGGDKNEVFSKGVPEEQGLDASIFGGKANKTAKDYDAIP